MPGVLQGTKQTKPGPETALLNILSGIQPRIVAKASMFQTGSVSVTQGKKLGQEIQSSNNFAKS